MWIIVIYYESPPAFQFHYLITIEIRAFLVENIFEVVFRCSWFVEAFFAQTIRQRSELVIVRKGKIR